MHESIQKFDVVIVGAGMVGAALACGLGQQGIRVALIDKALPKSLGENEPPRIRVSAFNLASEQLFRGIGAWSYITEQRLLPYTYLAVNELAAKTGLWSKMPDISSWATTRFDANEIQRDHLGHIIENDVVQLGLLKRVADLADVSLMDGLSVDRIELDETKRNIFLSDGRQLETSLLVGADGAQSSVRKLVGIGQRSEAYEQHALVMTVRYEGALEEGTWQAFRPEGPVAFLPLAPVDGKHYGSLVWYDSPAQITHLKGLDESSLVQKIQTVFPKALPEITEVLQIASFPLAKSHAMQYWKERVVLVGDSAHTINPLAGQGVNLGLMDAAVLIEKLGQAKIAGLDLSDDATLRAYESVRRKYNQLMMSAMDTFYWGFSNNHGPLRVIRNLGLGMAQRSGPIKRKVIELATGLQGEIPRLAKVE